MAPFFASIIYAAFKFHRPGLDTILPIAFYDYCQLPWTSAYTTPGPLNPGTVWKAVLWRF
ncbi:hypothetical protein SCP_1601090 [Sparassis crispa]|uniref:Uncharacterized protein n=1 Tax=Sparassis crispa TaxID=139825 RepID=A0A401H4T9_9APHY|nr:hypothetical protein SCP_1601090 [Sparassis crispa]GBE89447.1 hypothetical protein SCP_1601090 [Sparassis crispa]